MTNSKALARERLVSAAADMISRRGLSAMSIRELAKHAKAPLGSTYHYFPGGKSQVASEAIRFAGNTVAQALTEALEAGPVKGLRHFLGLWRDILIRSDFQAGCPVLSVATEEPAGEEGLAALEIAAAVFDNWESLLRDSLQLHGARKAPAAKLATLILASVEGSIAMCRARRSIKPLDDISSQLEFMIQLAISK
ncbi:TetR/AcrR family transcriptional regulator [Microbulbifer aggregans]|uniref:TetR/AcrR family transcriptional regulator n=1 Tax=Microbulbifer aggregans TaxID=1769779 RepID=UPI001CFF2A3F|nr:TetR/AcrR family transcriptional regulator [Microbulbifer aggregans]